MAVWVCQYRTGPPAGRFGLAVRFCRVYTREYVSATAELVSLAAVRDATRTGRAKRLREDAGLSQSEVARAIRVSQACLSRWESGHRAPRGRAALRYARLLAQLKDAAGAV